MIYSLFITCPKGIENLLETEIAALGATAIKQTVGGVHCQGDLQTIYQLCLWSRLANRVLLQLFSGEIADSKALYALCHAYNWTKLFKKK